MSELKEEDAGIDSSFDYNSPQFCCRFYENEFPDADEVVMVLVTEVGDMGAYVKLQEYGKFDESGAYKQLDVRVSIVYFVGSFSPTVI